ncbi:hypothetical protein KEM60_02330 [Austwickia sp. TVS 96-490-7B]|uniref:SAV_6107 family HEPN domain-containing protein n=1 Tax=Austwickia sp. TVS 96-490-7B TaxID=2830843 RepID=UPI001C59BC6B|nr:SAV_6107 family HEPN domain-containing protein [Austwickia sp. TVS 96-490-7B]MBW3086119.1 hypothetical protein [Austwickia sp. TVS 96-490-7B]
MPTITRTRHSTADHTRLGQALDLLDRSHGSLMQACHAEHTTDRYVAAHLGALRAAAALMAARPAPTRRQAAIRNVWAHLWVIAPELGEWSDYFALAGKRRAEVEAGAVPSRREADDLLRSAEAFICLVQGALGLPVDLALSQTPLVASACHRSS